MNKEEYVAMLAAKLEHYTARAAQNLDCAGVFTDVNWDEEFSAENDHYLSRLTQSKVVTRNAIEKARRAESDRQTQVAAISAIIETKEGEDPTTPHGFVYGRMRKIGATVTFKGNLIINGTDNALNDLQRQLRITAREVGFNPSDRSGIDDCAIEWFESAKRERVRLKQEQFAERQSFDFDHFSQTYFKETHGCSHELVAAILKKFVYDVRRKLAGRQIDNHLMPVLHGVQGCGKSYLLEKMLAPLAEFTAWSDFDQISDPRNLDLWKHFVIVLDEMAKAARADIDTVKHVISSSSLDRRPMRQNYTVQVKNCAVLIGASNHRVDELIRDETGNRRFVETLFRENVEHSEIKQFDFVAMWAAIQPDDSDPILPMLEELKEYQSMTAVSGPVLDWLQNRRDTLQPRAYTTEQLFDRFRSYREIVTHGRDLQARTMTTFSSELRRVTEQSEVWGIDKVRHAAGFRWQVSDRWKVAA